VCIEKDVFQEVDTSLSAEMDLLDEFLFISVKPEEYKAVTAARKQSQDEGSNATLYFALFRTLAAYWEEDLAKIFFLTDKEETCRDVPAPHLVIKDNDYRNIHLYLDRTMIFGQLSM
jgi:hypothetical protein